MDGVCGPGFEYLVFIYSVVLSYTVRRYSAVII